jgi:hypothetical protein
MKVIFTASLRGKKYFEDQYKQLFQAINELGYENIADDLMKPSTNKVYMDLLEGGREANIALYKKKIEDIQKADICVFECSAHSLSVGFVVQKSLELSKPTVVLYYKNNDPEFLEGVDDEKLIIRSYDDTNYKEVIKEALTEAENQRDKRFNFFISPYLLNFLNRAAKDQGVTKSTFIRNLILEHKRRSPGSTASSPTTAS